MNHPVPGLSISVVILSWNRREEVIGAIDRLREIFDGEIVVVDQGSTDGSREVLADRDDLTLVALGENVGVAEGRNIGNRLASGDIIVSLDSDAVLSSRFSFLELAELFALNPKLSVAAFRVLDSLSGYEVWPHAAPADDEPVAFESTRFAGGGHAVRKSAFEQVGGYDPTLFFYWEEMDLAARLIAHGHYIRYQPNFVVDHTPSTEARVDWGDARFYYRVRNRLYLIRKYFRGWSKARELLFISVGYLALGFRVGLLRQAIRGVKDGFRMRLPSDAAGFAFDRFYPVWERLERANRPGPMQWLHKTTELLSRDYVGGGQSA